MLCDGDVKRYGLSLGGYTGVIFIYITIYISTNSNAFRFLCFNSFVLPTRHHTPTNNNNEDKIVLNTDNFMIFAILHSYNFTLVIDTTVQNNDNEISLNLSLRDSFL